MLSLLFVLGAIEVGEWSAPACPASLLQARVPGQATGVRVSVVEQGGVLVGSLEVTREGKTRKRTHEANSCEALIDVLALGVELAQHTKPRPLSPVGERDWVRAAVERKEESKPVELTAPVVETPPVEVAVVEAPPPAEERPLTPALSPTGGEGAPLPPPPVVAAEVEPPPLAPSSHFEVAANALLVFGITPTAAFGAALSASWVGPLRVELSLQHARTDTVRLGPGRGRFSLNTARLAACTPSLQLGLAAAAVCGSLAGGAMWGQGRPTAAIVNAYEVTVPWFDASAQARVGVELGRGFKVEARAGPVFPFTTHAFVFDSPQVELFSVPHVGFEGGVGLSYSP